MKAMTPIGPLVGKMMGQPPNLRELISSADGVTFWASHEKATRSSATQPRGLEEGLRATLEAEGKLPRRPRPASVCRDARHRRRAPRAPARDRLLGGRRGAGRSRPRVLAADAAGQLWTTSSRRRSLLTHIHLDHAAATGAMVRRWPDLRSTSTSAAPRT